MEGESQNSTCSRSIVCGSMQINIYNECECVCELLDFWYGIDGLLQLMHITTILSIYFVPS